MNAVGYVYPWDLDGSDDQALERIAGTGVDALAVAANYHSTRAATPEHPARRTVDARHAASYVPVRPAAWTGRRLVPRVPDWTSADAALSAGARVREAGLELHAWVVLTHNSILGRHAPELTVRNAFGERYAYALCPSADEVAQYGTTVTTEIVEQLQPDVVVLEACGALGVDHGGEHDKTEFARWSVHLRDLLSVCFCDACRAGYRTRGVDPDDAAAAIRVAARPDADHRSPDEVLGEAADAILRARAAAGGRLLSTIAAAVRDRRPGTGVTVHASGRPWASGAFPYLDADAVAQVDTVVASCWDAPAANVQALAGLARRAPAPRRVGGYVRADTAADVAPSELVARYADAGLDEVHLYHLGLVAGADRARLADYAAAAHR